MFWSKSPVIRAWLLHSIEWPKEFDSPYENLAPLEKQVTLERRDPKEAILRKALGEYDLILVRAAAEALGDRLATEEASNVVTRLLKSDYRADFVTGVSLCWKYQGKQEAIRLAMDAPESVRPFILEFVREMEGEERDKTTNRLAVPTHFELVPRLMSSFEHLREVISIDLGQHTFEEWRPILAAMLDLKNPIAREIAANSLGELLSQKGVSPNKEAFDLARRVGFDPSPAVAGVAIQYSGLPTELQLAIFTRAYPRLDDEGRWGRDPGSVSFSRSRRRRCFEAYRRREQSARCGDGPGSNGLPKALGTLSEESARPRVVCRPARNRALLPGGCTRSRP